MANTLCAVLCIFFVLFLWLALTYNKCARDNSAGKETSKEQYLSGYGIISSLAFNNKGYHFPGSASGHSSGGYTIPHRVIV